MTRITAKLRAAALILSSERLADCHENAILDAVRRGDVTHAQVYQAMHDLGWRWRKDGWPWFDWRWVHNLPQWLRDLEGKGFE